MTDTWWRRRARRAAVAGAVALLAAGCRGRRAAELPTITIAGSSVGSEGAVLRRQVARFERLHPGLHVVIQSTPDDATQRHQLFVQWLNAHAGTPDVLQLDVVWTPEFAAAGWILPLDRYAPPMRDFVSAAVRASRWDGRTYAIPWFVDVGLLYWRTDLVPHPPASLDEMVALAQRGMRGPQGARWGIVWQGARYEGLVTTFVEYLGAFGGSILDDSGRVVVDSPQGVRALTFMRDEITRWHVTPADVLTWHEEETRFAFQNGDAVFMRNWPYAAALMRDSARSKVAGRFAVTVMPAAPGGHPTAALGGAELAINAYTAHPAESYALVAYLTAPEQMLERARGTGQYPARTALYHDPRLAAALPVSLAQVRAAVERAEPRPVTPVYAELSEALQIQLHRALTGQTAPAAALHAAARGMRAVLRDAGLAPTDVASAPGRAANGPGT